MNESQRHNADWKKPDRKEYMLDGMTWHVQWQEVQEQGKQICGERSQNSYLCGSRWCLLTEKGHGFSWGVGSILSFDLDAITWFTCIHPAYICENSLHCTVWFVRFAVYMLYLSKKIFKKIIMINRTNNYRNLPVKSSLYFSLIEKQKNQKPSVFLLLLL